MPTFNEISPPGVKHDKDQGVSPQQLAGRATEKMTSKLRSPACRYPLSSG